MNANNNVHSLISHYEVLCKKAMEEYEQARAKMLRPKRVERFEDKVYFQREELSLKDLDLDNERSEETASCDRNVELNIDQKSAGNEEISKSNEDSMPNEARIEEINKNDTIEITRRQAQMMLEKYEDIIGDDSEDSEEYSEEDSNSEGAYYMGVEQIEVQDDYEEPQHLNEDNLYDFIRKKEGSIDIVKQNLQNKEALNYDFVVRKSDGDQEDYACNNNLQNESGNQEEAYESPDELYDFVKPSQKNRRKNRESRKLNCDDEGNEENCYDFVVRPAAKTDKAEDEELSPDETYDFVTRGNKEEDEESEDESSKYYDFVVRSKDKKENLHEQTHFLEARNRAGKINRSESLQEYLKNEEEDTCDSASNQNYERSIAEYGNLRGETQEECEDYDKGEIVEDNNNNVCVLKEDRDAVRYFFFNSEEAHLQHGNLLEEDLYNNLQQEFLNENLGDHLCGNEDLYENLQQEFLNENLGENCELSPKSQGKFYKNLPSPQIRNNGGEANKYKKKIKRKGSFVSYISTENNEDKFNEDVTKKNKKNVRYADYEIKSKTIKSDQYQDRKEVERRLAWNENQRIYYDTPRSCKTKDNKVDAVGRRENKKATLYDCEACKKSEQNSIGGKKEYEERNEDANNKTNEGENMETRMIKSVNQQRPLEENIANNKPVHEKSIFVMDELIKTEQEYLKTMNFVLKHYMLYLSRLYKECSMAKFKNVFGNMDKIYEDTLGFLTDIIHCRYDYEKVGQTFLQYKEMFGKYPFYCKNRNLSHRLVVGEFKNFITKRQVELNDKLGLNSHLQTPVQRLVRYEMLLKSLEKSLKDSSINTKTLEDAIKLIQHVAQKGNDLVSIEPIGFSPFPIKKTGGFLMKDSFKLVSPHREDVVLFLYKKMIILAVENAKNVDGFIYRTSISMDSLAKIADDVSLYITLQNYDKRSTSPAFILKARDMDLKRKWVVKIDEILWAQLEHFRDMAKSSKHSEVPAIPIKNETKNSTPLKRSELIRRSRDERPTIKSNQKQSSNKDYNSS